MRHFGDGQDFEAAYSGLVDNPAKADVCKRLEAVIYNYFNSLRLPDAPTLYDHLILSLRPKDVIATFNWDPFLLQAARRNSLPEGKLPTLVFLHGNVLAGYCPRDRVRAVKNTICSRCGLLFERSRLLYPVAKKDYSTDPMIADSWQGLQKAMDSAFMVTVFGYSAPATDRDAVELLKGTLTDPERLRFRQFEIVDIRDPDELREVWSDFVHTHHYEVHGSFYGSWIARHPRRTGEAYWNQEIQGQFIADNPLPASVGFDDLWEWFQPLLSAEESASHE